MLTLADLRRMIRDAAYANATALRRLDFLDRLASLLGSSRLSLP